ncbi:integral membrane protein GPR137C [Platysternon megacephalum]|uniref:Integral membrane protein GPR137C n=1 Tax=Platysternon megacephalum TaxID=55544 RepID=A0A4D9EKH1_9SAUR|nr:integral membrane protein GPR137C [Platysternon megacephalum]
MGPEQRYTRPGEAAGLQDGGRHWRWLGRSSDWLFLSLEPLRWARARALTSRCPPRPQQSRLGNRAPSAQRCDAAGSRQPGSACTGFSPPSGGDLCWLGKAGHVCS